MSIKIGEFVVEIYGPDSSKYVGLYEFDEANQSVVDTLIATERGLEDELTKLLPIGFSMKIRH